MASDDDVQAGLSELKRAERDARRAQRGSRGRGLSQFTGGDDSSAPSPVAKKSSPKPLSMLQEEAKSLKAGGIGHIGKGKDETITFPEWIAKLNRVMPFLGKDLSYKAQIVAAEGVAGLLRAYLLDGVDPALSGMTVGLHKNRLGINKPETASRPLTEHDDRRVEGSALAALAPHLVVKSPPKMRTRGGKAKDGKPGFPGVFAKGYAPCTISFDSDKTDKIAYVLEHGRIWKPSEGIRKALMGRAIEGGFKPSEKSTTGYWEIPPRPFSHILVGPEAQRIVRKTAEAVMMGTLRQEIRKRKELYVDAMDHAGTDISELSETLGADDGGEDWTDLIQMGRGRKKR